MADVTAAMQWLRDRSTKATLDGMARYNIPSDNALGVAVRDIKALGKQLGRNQELAAALWKTKVYEARMLASFVGDPDNITSSTMDSWCHDFDNWGICDTLCFNLFDRTPFAWEKVHRWSRSRQEFVKRAGFALLWSLSVHDKKATNEQFVKGLALIPKAASDERDLVKKGVNMALRAVGKRNPELRQVAITIAQQLADSSDRNERRVGRDAIRELKSGGSRK